VKLLGSVKGIAHVSFTSADIVRHPLVTRIVEAYEQAGKKPPGRKG
jgi:phosphate starvation-inducible PhoH-like protein